MTPFSVSTFAIVATFAAGLTSALNAQDKSAAPLSTVEIQQLISRGQPADHAQLSAHFTALADEQAADAKRHTAMQQAYAGSNKAGAVSMSAHCKQLASRSQTSAASLRELAAYHSKLAAGAKAEAPSPAATTGRTPTDAELVRLAGSAESAADHRALESYFASIANRYDREAADHAAYAKTWQGLNRVPASADQATLHDKEAAARREAAAEARTAASMHRDMAAKAK